MPTATRCLDSEAAGEHPALNRLFQIVPSGQCSYQRSGALTIIRRRRISIGEGDWLPHRAAEPIPYCSGSTRDRAPFWALMPTTPEGGRTTQIWSNRPDPQPRRPEKGGEGFP